MRPAFPLAALVGQGSLVEALLVCAVDPGVGGVLVRGDRGTAKTTAVRGLAAVLPPVVARADGFAPGDLAPDGVVGADVAVAARPARLVELPLGATLDRLVGSLDLGRALAGEHAFEPGLLARAHRGVLYVDEVNLLPDHLVDALLDAAATGVCRVEREAVSVAHDARVTLIGTMNPEEGELRPQLLDRFGLGVEVTTPRDPGERAEVVRRRLAFEAAPEAFVARFAAEQDAVRARISAARTARPDVGLGDRALALVTRTCAELGLDGVRGDVVCARAAIALAALDGALEVDADHVRRAALLALAHRRRRDPLEPPEAGPQEIADAVGAAEQALAQDRPPVEAPPAPGGRDADPDDDPSPPSPPSPPGDAAPAPPDAPADPTRAAAPRVPDPERAALRSHLELLGRGSGPAGRRGRSAGPQAGAIDARPAAAGEADLALVPSLLAGAPRAHVRAGREAALLVLVVDTSGSMAARARLARVKGALLDVLRDAYARRDRVALIAFRDAGAELLAAPGTPLEQAAAAIRALPAGGRTPLAAGLDAAARLIAREAARDPERRALCVVLTDGRAADPGGAVPAAAARLGARAAAVHVVDLEDGPVRLGLAGTLAAAAGATLTPLTIRPTRSAA